MYLLILMIIVYNEPKMNSPQKIYLYINIYIGEFSGRKNCGKKKNVEEFRKELESVL